MIRNHSPISKLQKTGNRIPSEPLSCYSMEKNCILLPHLDIPNGTSLFPVQILQTQQMFHMQLNNLPKIELLPIQRPQFLQIIQNNNDLVALTY